MSKVNRVKEHEIYIDAARFATIDFSASASKLGTTVSTVAWSIEEGSTVTISNESLTNGVAKALLTSSTDSTGCNLIKARAVMANGEILPGYIEMEVIKPSC
jgi:hypothetical protein